MVWVGFCLAFFIHARTSFQHVRGQLNSYHLPEERKNIWRVLESNPGPHAVQATTYFDILGQVVLSLKISSSKKIEFQQATTLTKLINCRSWSCSLDPKSRPPPDSSGSHLLCLHNLSADRNKTTRNSPFPLCLSLSLSLSLIHSSTHSHSTTSMCW